MKNHIKIRNKILISIIIIIMLFNFIFQKPVQASLFGKAVGAAAGALMPIICDFALFLRRYSFKYSSNYFICWSRYNDRS